MAANFELSSIPSCVFVRWSLNKAELCFVRRIIGMDLQGQLDYVILLVSYFRVYNRVALTFQESMALVPVDLRVEAEERTRVLLQRSCGVVSIHMSNL